MLHDKLYLQNQTAEMRRCLENCTECHAICTATVNHCLTLGGEHARAYHIGTLLDCAQICQTSADFMLRNSPQHHMVCGVCAQACDRCADECEQMANGDRMMMECARVCRACAESCREMARSMPHDDHMGQH